MPKLYDEKPKADELLLRSFQGGDDIYLALVNKSGLTEVQVGRIASDGLHPNPLVPPPLAARAGMADAFDANGRLKVIGEAVEAERMGAVTYNGRDSGRMVVRQRLSSTHFDVTGAVGQPETVGQLETVSITNDDLVDLHARIGRHIAWLKQEGKL